MKISSMFLAIIGVIIVLFGVYFVNSYFGNGDVHTIIISLLSLLLYRSYRLEFDNFKGR